jgi:hypothetical protein
MPDLDRSRVSSRRPRQRPVEHPGHATPADVERVAQRVMCDSIRPRAASGKPAARPGEELRPLSSQLAQLGVDPAFAKHVPLAQARQA